MEGTREILIEVDYVRVFTADQEAFLCTPPTHPSFQTNAPLIWNPRTCPSPPIRALAGDCGDFHVIYTSFWFPGRRGIRLKSRSSHPLPGCLLAAQWSICLFHSCQQCSLTSVLRLAITSCFTKGVLQCFTKLFYKGSFTKGVGAGECTIHFCPREPEPSLTFTCIKSECPAQARMGGGGVGVSNHFFYDFNILLNKKWTRWCPVAPPISISHCDIWKNRWVWTIHLGFSALITSDSGIFP